MVVFDSQSSLVIMKKYSGEGGFLILCGIMISVFKLNYSEFKTVYMVESPLHRVGRQTLTKPATDVIQEEEVLL